MANYFRDPKDCGNYHVCVHGNVTTRTCPHGLVFSVAIGACDWLSNVPECAGYKPPITTTTTTMRPAYTTPIITIPTQPPMQMEGECKNRRPDELFRYVTEFWGLKHSDSEAALQQSSTWIPGIPGVAGIPGIHVENYAEVLLFTTDVE